HPDYVLRLFVSGPGPASSRAIQNLKEICEEYLPGHHSLDIIDLYKHPEASKKEQIVATPTLVKKSPNPLRIILGDLADRERVLGILGLAFSGS
ncbi:MAG: circadian clock KaiB family protein, partial [Terriglobia bacterium]